MSSVHSVGQSAEVIQERLWSRAGLNVSSDTEIGIGRLPRQGGPLGPDGRPDVSILVTVYNHERFIEHCLRSIALQQTGFSYEVLVGEDCSTDGTRPLLKSLEDKLPENFVFLYRRHNFGAVPNGRDLYVRARGRYFAGLEGDDFWIYEGKLQRQVAFLESHPDYSATYTNCLVVGEDGEPNGERYPQCLEEEYSWREYFYSCMPGHHGTLVCRWPEFLAAYREFDRMAEYDSYPGDRRNAFLFLTLGRVRCIQERWSSYRHVVKKGAANYSSTVVFDESYARNEIGFGRSLVKWAKLHGSKEARRIARRTYWRFLLKWSFDSRVKSYRLSDALRELMKESDWLSLALAPLQWYAVLGLRALRGRPVDL